jgi:hypothetical protein
MCEYHSIDSLVDTLRDRTDEWGRWNNSFHGDSEEEEKVWVEILKPENSQTIKTGKVDFEG